MFYSRPHNKWNTLKTHGIFFHVLEVLKLLETISDVRTGCSIHSSTFLHLLHLSITTLWAIKLIRLKVSYRLSLAIWDHTVVTCHSTQVNSNTHWLNRSKTGWYLIYPPQRDVRLSWATWLVTYRYGLPVHRWSPIQVLTQQCMAGSWTHNL